MSLLGIDLGTTGIKCIVYNEDGKVLGKTYREYTLSTPRPGIVELDPKTVWSRLGQNIGKLNEFQEIAKDPIEALSISVSGDEALPIDSNGNPIYNTIMSMDKRGREENNYINKILGAEKIYEITGQPPSSMYALNRLIWLRNNEPEIYSKIYKFLCWEDYILFMLGAEPVTDPTVASRTLAFDIRKNIWSDYILEKVEIDKGLFPEVVSSGTEVGKINRTIADTLNLSKNVKLVTGGFDQACAAFGSGVIKNGMASVGTGTMEVMQVCFDEPAISKSMFSNGYPFSNHIIKDKYICLSINFCAGAIIRWYRDNLLPLEKEVAQNNNIDIYEVMMKKTIESKYPVTFLPYFEGAQTPLNNPDATGVIFGLTLRTKEEDILKGILEGITFDLRLNIERIEESGTRVDALRASGGGAKSDIWLQIKADIIKKPIVKLKDSEAGCMSAAILAGFGIGVFNSIEDTVNGWVKIEKELLPRSDNNYDKKYQQFLNIYESLKDYKILY